MLARLAHYRRPSLGLRIRTDPAEYAKQRFVQWAARQIKPGQRILDAGGGECPHRPYFSHATYESCDFIQNRDSSHTFLCDLQNIPAPDNSYDAVLCIQVLDDIPDPARALAELHRILKPDGSLFLTAP